MTVLEVKEQAKRKYSEGKYLSAFETLNQLPADDFVQYAQTIGQSKHPNKWLTSPTSRDVFWGDFLLHPDVFNKFFESEQAGQLLHLYFTQVKQIYPSFLSAVASSYPDLLIKGIRLSSAFLNDEQFMSFDCIRDSGNEKLQLHYRAQKKLKDTEALLWKKVEEWSTCLDGYVLNSAIIEVVLWLETKHFEAKFDLNSLHHLASVYNTFVELFAYKRKNKLSTFIKNFNETALDERFYKLFIPADKKHYVKITNGSMFGLLDKISDWVDFKEGILSSYCHDLTYDVYSTSVGLELKNDSEKYYRWKLDGGRYFLTHGYYTTLSSLFVYENVEAGNITIPRKDSPFDYKINYGLCVNNYASDFFLSDLCIDHFSFKGRDIAVSTVSRMLQALSANRASRVELLKLEYSPKATSWFEMYQAIVKNLLFDTRRREPYWCVDSKEFVGQTRTVLNHTTFQEGELECVVEMESYEIGRGENFDRFNIRYNVFFSPFLKIGTYLFTPVIFLANNFVFFNVAQLALRQSTARNNRAKTNLETFELEKHLAGILSSKNWKITHITPEQSNEINGDVDIIADDGTELLFIQLKRTYFRLNLKDAYYESELVDKHASEQLNDAVKDIDRSILLQDITGIKSGSKPRKITKWIVSTSFESCGTQVNGCDKVNYYELITFLKLNHCSKLSEVISEFGQSLHLKKLGLTADVFPFEAHRSVLEVHDNEQASKFNILFNQGIAFNEKGEYKNAQTSLLECLKIYPDELTCLHALANVYANARKYNDALQTFDSALEVSREEPAVWIDKANCLWENQQNLEALAEFLKIFRKYRWFGLEETINELFKRCTEHRLLSESDYVKLKGEYDDLRG